MEKDQKAVKQSNHKRSRLRAFRKTAKEITQELTCQFCETPIKLPRTKFCSRSCGLKLHRKISGVRYTQEQASTPHGLLRKLRTSTPGRTGLSMQFLDDLYAKQNGLCSISGLPLTTIQGNGFEPLNISLDRIDNSIGYEEHNVQLVGRWINLMKNVMTTEQLVEMCKTIAKYHDDKENPA